MTELTLQRPHVPWMIRVAMDSGLPYYTAHALANETEDWANTEGLHLTASDVAASLLHLDTLIDRELGQQ